MTKEEAMKFFREKGDEYKTELIGELEDGTISFYHQGNFTDLCRGPHLADTTPIKAIKLLSVAGAYWRGDEKRKQLTRIYGVTFPKQKMLEEAPGNAGAGQAARSQETGQGTGAFYFFPARRTPDCLSGCPRVLNSGRGWKIF